MDQTLKSHSEAIEEHDDELCKIRQDLIDIKTRLGIKDLTNGQVLEYHKQLVKTLEDEKKERKEQDNFLREDIKDLRGITWMIMTGVVLAILIEIASFFAPKIVGVFL